MSFDFKPGIKLIHETFMGFGKSSMYIWVVIVLVLAIWQMFILIPNRPFAFNFGIMFMACFGMYYWMFKFAKRFEEEY